MTGFVVMRFRRVIADASFFSSASAGALFGSSESDSFRNAFASAPVTARQSMTRAVWFAAANAGAQLLPLRTNDVCPIGDLTERQARSHPSRLPERLNAQAMKRKGIMARVRSSE
jgi:hypothetical protein